MLLTASKLMLNKGLGCLKKMTMLHSETRKQDKNRHL